MVEERGGETDSGGHQNLKAYACQVEKGGGGGERAREFESVSTVL